MKIDEALPSISNGKCIRISRSSTIMLNAPITEVFPLFGPIREKDWAYGWNPEVLFSKSPLVEEKMIFRTPAADGPYTWVVTRYEPARHLVEYLVSAQARVWFIAVSCKAQQQMTVASVTYTYTGLTAEGNAINEKAMQEMFRHDLRDWEEAINHYLLAGTALHPDKALFN
jgi:hypothetical protein